MGRSEGVDERLIDHPLIVEEMQAWSMYPPFDHHKDLRSSPSKNEWRLGMEIVEKPEPEDEDYTKHEEELVLKEPPLPSAKRRRQITKADVYNAEHPLSLSGYYVSADFSHWAIIRGDDRRPFYGRKAGTEERPFTKALLVIKELIFLQRFLTDIRSLTRRLNRRPIDELEKTAEKYSWGPIPSIFKTSQDELPERSRLTRSAVTVCNLWPAPFIALMWCYFQQYYREFPEVMTIKPLTGNWFRLTAHARDMLVFLKVEFEEFLRSRELKPVVLPHANIPRSGHVVNDVYRCFRDMAPKFNPEGTDNYFYPYIMFDAMDDIESEEELEVPRDHARLRLAMHVNGMGPRVIPDVQHIFRMRAAAKLPPVPVLPYRKKDAAETSSDSDDPASNPNPPPNQEKEMDDDIREFLHHQDACVGKRPHNALSRQFKCVHCEAEKQKEQNGEKTESKTSTANPPVQDLRIKTEKPDD